MHESNNVVYLRRCEKRQAENSGSALAIFSPFDLDPISPPSLHRGERERPQSTSRCSRMSGRGLPLLHLHSVTSPRTTAMVAIIPRSHAPSLRPSLSSTSRIVFVQLPSARLPNNGPLWPLLSLLYAFAICLLTSASVVVSLMSLLSRFFFLSLRPLPFLVVKTLCSA